MMNRLRKLGRILQTLFNQPASLNKVLDDSAVWKHQVARMGFEKGLPVLSIFNLIPDEEWVADPYLFLDGGSLPTDLVLLRHLASRFSPCRYFEIGTWRGESTANVAQVAAECYTLNLPESEMQALGIPVARSRQLGMLSQAYPHIIHLSGDSRSFDFSQFDQPFDLVFIDGDHHYAQVKNDTEKVFKHLIHPGSIIAWHDYAHHPEEVRHEVLAGILDGLPKTEHAHLFHVSHTKTAIFSRGIFRGHTVDLEARPNQAFSLRIKHARIPGD